MKEEELKKNKKSLEEQAQKRIKTGLILNAFGEKIISKFLEMK